MPSFGPERRSFITVILHERQLSDSHDYLTTIVRLHAAWTTIASPVNTAMLKHLKFVKFHPGLKSVELFIRILEFDTRTSTRSVVLKKMTQHSWPLRTNNVTIFMRKRGIITNAGLHSSANVGCHSNYFFYFIFTDCHTSYSSQARNSVREGWYRALLPSTGQ